ncbi:hypothetical protein GCM10011394_27410 [Luteimonas terricola]|uniref:Uncharacterized protein n=2 Tax=Luteimonas terricola TaxID=645597 RepID=A0ABQ2ELX2_9GAMM|nr:hypothetical protein GCM10011394_27410 [Luteimonas terricola]
MQLPAQAFVEVRPSALPPGRLVRVRGCWSLLVDLQLRHGQQSRLILQGPHQGHLVAVGPGVPECTTIAAEFGWFPSLDWNALATDQTPYSGALVLTSDGPVLIGSDPDDGDQYAFRMDGTHVEKYYASPAHTRFERWSVELSLDERPFESLGLLLAVDLGTLKGTAGA